MFEKKKVIIIGKNRKLNIISENMFRLNGYETIICCDEKEAHELHRSEGDTIECVFYPKKIDDSDYD
ncbi:hypothetical protein LCGC14_0676500 [marine sediment metagenome]|uniref:RCK N-terminal domain-containing protein n=1 Tax=marine sediment metagenome TaxID=412755 RepID=A0A0F9R9L4_9ZZZZ|nr:MAG: hypothetical protein Lokiarch_37930 [Candidatus Lokiarchaeum sp. GC14_75]